MAPEARGALDPMPARPSMDLTQVEAKAPKLSLMEALRGRGQLTQPSLANMPVEPQLRNMPVNQAAINAPPNANMMLIREDPGASMVRPHALSASDMPPGEG